MTRKILIVDDEPNIVISLEFLMRREGFEVAVARDGEEAMTSVRQEQPDLVLLDVMMPKLNGFQVCEQIRADPALAGVHAQAGLADLVFGADHAVAAVAALAEAADLARLARHGLAELVEAEAAGLQRGRRRLLCRHACHRGRRLTCLPVPPLAQHPAQPEDHAPLVLGHHLDHHQYKDETDDRDLAVDRITALCVAPPRRC